MKRLLFPVLALALAGCGSLNAAPTAGQLLDAPTTLNVAGTPLTAEAAPLLSGDLFSVKIKVKTARSALPDLKITEVYVVTNDGVWSAPATVGSQWRCAANCAFALGSGPANGLQAGEGVQVVIGLQDNQGRQLLLRDAQAKVK